MVDTNCEASKRSLVVPASNQDPPLPICSTFNELTFLYSFIKSVISSSFLFEGFNFSESFTTLLLNK